MTDAGTLIDIRETGLPRQGRWQKIFGVKQDGSRIVAEHGNLLDKASWIYREGSTPYSALHLFPDAKFRRQRVCRTKFGGAVDTG